jgi:hypothetical protein
MGSAVWENKSKFRTQERSACEHKAEVADVVVGAAGALGAELATVRLRRESFNEGE